MPIGVVIIEISHEEIRHDFLLYKAGNHSTPFVKPDFEEVKTFRIHPHVSDQALASREQLVFILPVFNSRIKSFIPLKTCNILRKNEKAKTRCSSCCVSALEQILASLIRKPPKRLLFFG